MRIEKGTHFMEVPFHEIRSKVEYKNVLGKSKKRDVTVFRQTFNPETFVPSIYFFVEYNHPFLKHAYVINNMELWVKFKKKFQPEAIK